jgi:SNF2-related domain
VADQAADASAADLCERMEIDVPPFFVQKKDIEPFMDTVKQSYADFVAAQTLRVNAVQDSLSLVSGGKNDVTGGTSLNAIDFESVMTKYHSEILPDIVVYKGRRHPPGLNCSINAAFGAVSHHRRMRRGGADLLASYYPSQDTSYDTPGILSAHEYGLAKGCLEDASTALMNEAKSLQGIMDHLENLGHASAPFVDGLTVDLLPFQSQALQWATERETTPGGLQSFWCTKLPSVAEPGKELYFNPTIGKLSVEKPALVRGGIIAAQMGLGKTVISLALILRNPAPALPISGSSSSSICDSPDMASGQPFWDPKWKKNIRDPTGENSVSHGSIISRGTLVVVRGSLSLRDCVFFS